MYCGRLLSGLDVKVKDEERRFNSSRRVSEVGRHLWKETGDGETPVEGDVLGETPVPRLSYVLVYVVRRLGYVESSSLGIGKVDCFDYLKFIS